MESLMLRMKILSPVHVYSGEVYEPTTYTKEKQKVNIYFKEDILKNLNIADINFMVENIMNDEEDLSKKHNFENLSGLISSNKISIKNINKRFTGVCIKDFDEFRNIRATSRELSKAMIPGSTIKGFIRNAVIYHYLKTQPQQLENYLDGNMYKSIDEYLFDRKYMYLDPFRFLRVEDVYFEGESIFAPEIVYDKLDTEKENFSIENLECLEENTISSIFKISLDKHRIAKWSVALKKAEISEKKEKKEKKENSSVKFMKKIYEEYFEGDLKNLIEAIKEFMKDVIEREKEYFSQGNEYVDKFINDVEKSLNDNIILRIGHGKGIHSNSLYLLYKILSEKNRNKYKVLLEEKYEIDDLDFDEFPYTRRLTSDERLFGFVEVERV